MGRRYGELSGRDKEGLNERAEMSDQIDLIGVQYQSGGVGIDLTRACYGVYYSQTWSLGDYLQSLKRLHRPGQERTTMYYHLVAAGTVDEIVYRALSKREEVVDAILGGLRK